MGMLIDQLLLNDSCTVPHFPKLVHHKYDSGLAFLRHLYWQFVLGFGGISRYQCQSSVHVETWALREDIRNTHTHSHLHTRSLKIAWCGKSKGSYSIWVRNSLIPLWHVTVWIFQVSNLHLCGVNSCDTADGDNESLYILFKQSRNNKRNGYTVRSRPTEGGAFTSSSRQYVALMLVSLQDDLC